jgi:hypothetical protein
VAVEQVLSTRFRSAAAFDGRNCPDLRTACEIDGLVFRSGFEAKSASR